MRTPDTMTLAEFKSSMKELGYQFASGKMERGKTSHGHEGWVTPGIQEIDTGISYAHYQDARRDDNFKALQDLRRWSIVQHKGMEVWV